MQGEQANKLKSDRLGTMNLFVLSGSTEIKINEACGKSIEPKPCEVLVVSADFNY
jgi:hypothetical protein